MASHPCHIGHSPSNTTPSSWDNCNGSPYKCLVYQCPFKMPLLQPQSIIHWLKMACNSHFTCFQWDHLFKTKYQLQSTDSLCEFTSSFFLHAQLTLGLSSFRLACKFSQHCFCVAILRIVAGRVLPIENLLQASYNGVMNSFYSYNVCQPMDSSLQCKSGNGLKWNMSNWTQFNIYLIQ